MRGLLLVTALAAALARAEEPAPAADPRLFAEPSADSSPTPYACNVETLSSGARCIFESLAPQASDPRRQAVENAQAAARLADALCAKAARHPQEPIPDADVLASCKRTFVEKAMGCGADGTRPILDEGGRFGPEFRVCYSAMSEALARARTMAGSSGPCCRCLVAAKCAASGERCNEETMMRTLEGAAARCAAESCREACRAHLPAPATASPARMPVVDPPSPCFDPLRLEAPCVKP
jgi:hypothetical protein